MSADVGKVIYELSLKMVEHEKEQEKTTYNDYLLDHSYLVSITKRFENESDDDEENDDFQLPIVLGRMILYKGMDNKSYFKLTDICTCQKCVVPPNQLNNLVVINQLILSSIARKFYLPMDYTKRMGIIKCQSTSTGINQERMVKSTFQRGSNILQV
jgi:hypothetical protein